MASGEHLHLNDCNAVVELLSPVMENLRIDKGSVGDIGIHLPISSTSAEEKEDEENIYVCMLSYSKYSSRRVDKRCPFLAHDTKDPLQIMEECDDTYGIPFQYCFFNMEELKQHTESHHYTQYSMKATTPINWTAYMVTTSMCWER